LGLAWRILLVLTGLFAAGIFLMIAPSLYVLATTKDLAALEPAAAEFLVLHQRIWPAALLAFGGVFVYSILLSNRIAGPLYRINAALRQMLRDETPDRIAFREPDFFHETAELLTQLSRKLADKRDGETSGGSARGPRERTP